MTATMKLVSKSSVEEIIEAMKLRSDLSNKVADIIDDLGVKLFVHGELSHGQEMLLRNTYYRTLRNAQ